MHILQYNELNITPVKKQFAKLLDYLQKADFKSADLKKMVGTDYYRAKLDDTNRLLIQFAHYNGATYMLLLEIILNHDYEKSRFLRGAKIDESKLQAVADASKIPAADSLPLVHINAKAKHFHVLDKILSFDDTQEGVFRTELPIIIIGSAGSGKTALTLEKLKQLHGRVLYVTLSPYLVENSRNLYYSNYYDNENQEIDFLSFTEYLQTIDIPKGKEMTFRTFGFWIAKYKQAYKIKDAYKLFEEFKGVITGSIIDKAHLTAEEYLKLGIKQSVYDQNDRPAVYELFTKYVEYLKDCPYYDSNMVAYERLAQVAPYYDYVVVDEVQDLTNIQLFLILKSLQNTKNFLLCGDSNQIVHPNFFSWANVKTMFYKQDLEGDIIRILATNYRNTPEVTGIANQLLLLKNARFGSIDRESTYLVKTNSEKQGEVQFLEDNASIKKELNQRTRRNTTYAVLVMRDEDKAAARQFFETPLIFSVQEAKGLEYENIVLFNIISANEAEFRELTNGVTPDDLRQDLVYSRAKDKSDKSLEVYKFYVNSLYVAMTRAVTNLYVVERAKKHDLLQLLGLTEFKQNVQLKTKDSSVEDWQREARKLEMQGKQEQADAIRKQILNILPVPWTVHDYGTRTEAITLALNPDHYNKKGKDFLFEYAAFYNVKAFMPLLSELKYKRAENFTRERDSFLKNALNDYAKDNIRSIQQNLNRYGYDFYNAYKQTPLMLATFVGSKHLTAQLLAEGADRQKQDMQGKTAFTIALSRAIESPAYAKTNLLTFYNTLKPDSIKVKIGNHLIKIDAHQAEYFMFSFMLADLQRAITNKFKIGKIGYETADFLEFFENMPASLLPEYRRKRSYLSSILSKNEFLRADIYNKKLFYRTRQGFYIPNPIAEVEYEGNWVNLYELMGIFELALSEEFDYMGMVEMFEYYKTLIIENPAISAAELDKMKSDYSFKVIKKRFNFGV
jgi:UvrD/REP helicase N-terminal domain